MTISWSFFGFIYHLNGRMIYCLKFFCYCLAYHPVSSNSKKLHSLFCYFISQLMEGSPLMRFGWCRSERKDAAYQDVMKDFPLALSDIFKPVYLFHLFLCEASIMHYLSSWRLTPHCYPLYQLVYFVKLKKAYYLVLIDLQIHYDHQVLLDYLISKDTGISCAKYLLR